MKNLRRVGVVCIVAVMAALAPRAAGQALPKDPALVSGELDNGLRYVVRQHAIPAGKATLWIHVHSGSLNETDRQRGIAHYLEHMAFNGSANFAPGTLVPFFQSLGMTFGRDQNAYTNMQETTYQLTLPDTKAETLGKGMMFFADVVGRLSLLPKEIDAERQIIQEERRRGLSGQQRTGLYVMEHLTPGSVYGQRMTIGKEETIGAVKEEDFRDYYGRWYGASNATLIVVADAPTDSVVKVIKEKFSDLPKKPRPTPNALNVKAYRQSFAIVASDPEVRSASLRIVRLEPARAAVTTLPLYRADLVGRLGEMSINRRLGDKVSRGGTSYLGANVSAGNQSNAIYTAEISGRATPEKWQVALEEIALELQRARAFGVTARELEDAKKQLVSGAERAVETEPTVPAGTLIRRINNDVGSGEPTLSATQRLDLLKQVLESITLEEVSKRLAEEFNPTAVAFVAVLPSTAHVPTESELLDLGTRALAAKPTKETEAARATTLINELPKGGAVKEGSEHAASKVWTGWLSNNARVNYRFMDEQKNEVSVRIALIGGELLETPANKGITRAAELALGRAAATQHLSSTDIRELMTGKKVRVGGGFGGGGGRGGRGGGGGGGGGADSISVSISGSPEELETGFQLAYLLLTEPKVEEAAFTQFQTTSRQMLAESIKNPMALARLTAKAMYPEGEVRTQPMTAEQVERLTPAGAQAWLEKLIKESPIEVTIVGDLPRERALELTARYIGALPAREKVSAGTYSALRKLERPKGPRVIEQTVETPTNQAYVFSGFYGTDESNVADARALTMAARVLSTRMVKEVREEAQLVYSIGASSRAATTYPGFGVFSASAPTDPAKTKALVEKLGSMFAKFAKEGPTEEEMGVAKKQMANTFDEQMRQAGYWTGRLQEIGFRGASLDEIVGTPAAYQALTPKQVQDTFAKYYTKENVITVVVLPGPGDVTK